jgi:hypothetical protein
VSVHIGHRVGVASLGLAIALAVGTPAFAGDRSTTNAANSSQSTIQNWYPSDFHPTWAGCWNARQRWIDLHGPNTVTVCERSEFGWFFWYWV